MFSFNDIIEFSNSKNDILAVGELLIDMISSDYGDNFEGGTYNSFFGGSPANIAMNAKRLGINSLIAAAVGKDGLGKFLTGELQRAGIDTEHIQKKDFSTSVVLVTKSKKSPIPIFYRDADFQLEYTDELGEAIKNSKIVHFSCWPISRQPSRHTIERVVLEAKKNNLLICFDPNYHPMIWEKGHKGIEYVKSLIGYVDIVKPSEDDAERLFGEDTHENQIKKFLDLGVKLVIMTIGKHGAIVSNGKETVKFDTFAEEVVDTTGAGDAFWSGFYTGLVKGYKLKEALELGFAVSAYKLRYTGAVVSLPPIKDIKDMFRI